ncbi:hypothetical protein HBH98_080220 [Parastagonospora nodorum]|nr:hypothetical protein HBH49_093550 [Parastagonospora nodorum]KAH4190526.1 hypothetical protein HBH42_130160 [Parastagonospora nodorum]KAH4348381.1 hypothetical protein HBH98_080220 [Parastagonospora nodorum]KAH4703358.1 hypothetical protein HBH67_118330 [Parastagonospora nodorum]KAH4967233.1 hypothetical protein HBI78_080250 [Parastagonospora nodorum]
MRVGKVNGPDARASADVQHAGGGAGYGRIVQLAAEEEQEDVVQQVEAVLLLLVVGEQVRAAAVGGVAAAIAVFVVEYGRGQGCRGGRGAVVGRVGVGVAGRVGLEVQDGLQVAVAGGVRVVRVESRGC